MTNPEHKDARWNEVKDGQKMWEKPKLCPGDNDRFQTEYVDPITQLQADGRFTIEIIAHNTRGQAGVPLAVKITSGINYD